MDSFMGQRQKLFLLARKWNAGQITSYVIDFHIILKNINNPSFNFQPKPFIYFDLVTCKNNRNSIKINTHYTM